DARDGAQMLDIRRDLYMTEPRGPAGAGLERPAAALAALVDAAGR
ncbi:N-formylglutamate amidohydrolase, partial [Streptomyces sp. NPDC005921]